MPVALLCADGEHGFAPVARPRFLLGRDLDCDLVDDSIGVADHHATLRYRRGEYLLKAEEGCSLWVDGERLPLYSLRNGDQVRLAPDAEPWVFRSRVEGSFWPPEVRLGEAWLAHPGFEDPGNGPARFGDGAPLGGSDPMRCRLVKTDSGPRVVKHLGPLETPKDATPFLRLLAAIGGAPHPALAPLVDGGLAPHEGEPWRWTATHYVEGTCARDLVESGRMPARRVLEVLRALAEGLRHLHHRGVIHGHVAPDHVIFPLDLPAVLIDYGAAVSSEQPLARAPGPPGTPGYVAPELRREGGVTLSPAVDAFGLGAVGFALLAGRAPEGEDARAVLQALRTAPSERWRLNEAATDILVSVLLEALDPDPAARPDLENMARALGFAEAQSLVRASS